MSRPASFAWGQNRERPRQLAGALASLVPCGAGHVGENGEVGCSSPAGEGLACPARFAVRGVQGGALGGRSLDWQGLKIEAQAA